MQSAQEVVLGRLTGAFGVKGWLKLSSFTRPAARIIDYAPWLLRAPDGCIEVQPIEFRPHGKGLIVRLEGVVDRDRADELRGMDIIVARDRLPEPEPGHYYWADLEGLEVSTTAGKQLGAVTEMIAAGAADVMVIEGERRVLVPFVIGETVVSVDLEAGTAVVAWGDDD